MNQLTSFLSEYFASVPERLRRRKRLAWLSFAIIAAVLFVSATRIQTDFTVDSWFNKDDPTFSAYDGYRAQFGSEDGLVIVYKAKDSNVFSAQSLEAVRRIRDELFYHRAQLKNGQPSALDHIVRVTTLVNVPVLRVQGDTLISRPLVGNTVPTSASELDEIRRTAEAQEDVPLRYFSRDLHYGGILIDTDFGAVPCEYDEKAAASTTAADRTIQDLTFDSAGADDAAHPCFKPTDMRDYQALNAAVKAILYKPEYAGHFDYYFVGNPEEAQYTQVREQEMGHLYLAAIAIMIVLLWLLFRSLSAVVWGISLVVLTTVFTFGVSAFLGLTLNPFVILTAFLLLTVGMADAIHLMSGYLFYRRQGSDHASALRSAYEKASVACLLTAITTMIGMASLTLSDIVPVKQVGIMGSMGVAIAFILTIYVLPMFLEVWAPAPKAENKSTGAPRLLVRLIPNVTAALQRVLTRIVPAVEKRPVSYCVPFFIVLMVCVYGAFQVKVDSDMLSLYAPDSQFPQSVKVVDDKMSGSAQMSIYMDFGASHAAEDPFVMGIVDELQKLFENKYGKYVVTTSSIVDIVKDTYRKLNQERADKYLIPADQGELSQTLYMFNNADPDQRKRLIDDSYRKANIRITMRNASSFEYSEVFDGMQKDVYASLSRIKQKYPDARVSITGNFVLKMRLEHLLVQTGLQSYSTAFAVINVLLFIIFMGSFKAGIIAIVPNVIPSVLVVGLMGLMDIPLDFFAIMLAPIIIGISVDDTIHFLTHYRMQYAVDGDIATALRHTMKEAGQGIVFTTMVLGLGFGILAVSSIPGVAKVGLFGSLAMFVGMLNDLFLLPALITLLKLRGDTVTDAKAHAALANTQSMETP